MRTGRPKTTGNCATRDDLEFSVIEHYRKTSDPLRVIAHWHRISAATVYRIVRHQTQPRS